MSDSRQLQRLIISFLDLYFQGEFTNLRIKTESLLAKEVVSQVTKGIKDTENLELGFRGPEPWRKCSEKWCKSPEEGVQCIHRKPFIKQLLDAMQNGDALFFERVMVLFWYALASARERWEDSFDYDSIGCRLHFARQVVDGALERINDPKQWKILECLHDMAIEVHHGAYVENSMICNNPVSFQRHAGMHAFYSRKIIDKLTSLKNDHETEDPNHYLIDLFALKLIEYLEPVEKQHKALEQVGELMKLRRTDRDMFSAKWASAMKEIRETCLTLEESANFEDSSELRAHIACLDFHQGKVQLSPLTLQVVDGFFQYGFFIEHDTENNILKESDGFFTNLSKYLEEYIGNDLGETTLISITEDPCPDILESSIGEEHFQNVLLFFKDIQLRELSTKPGEPGPYIATLTPKLYHYVLGVGMLSFEFRLEEVSVPDFYAIKHMASRHSGQYEFWTTDEEGNPESIYSQTRLVDLADKIINGYSERFLAFCQGQCAKGIKYELKSWIEVDQTWFTHFEFYRIHDKEGNQLDSEELEKHPEFPGIVAYQRADRSSLDDWINLSVKYMHLTNLAPIRAHKGDLYIISENHSICYLPDDPKFIVLQYGETSKWVFLIRCLMLYCMAESHRVLALLKNDFGMLNSSWLHKKVKLSELEEHLKKLKMKRTEVQRHRMLTISILEHAVSLGVSQYADHGLLLKRAFEETGIVQIIDRLEDRTEGLEAIQEGIKVGMEDLKASQNELSRQRLNLVLVILTIVQLVQSVAVIYGMYSGSSQNLWEFLIWVATCGMFIGGIVIYYFPPKFLYKRNR